MHNLSGHDTDLFTNETGNDDTSLQKSPLDFDSYLAMKASEVQKIVSRIHTTRDTKAIPLLLHLQHHTSVAVKRKVVKILAEIATKYHTDALEQWKQSETDKETHLLLESALQTIAAIETRQDGNNVVMKVADVLAIMKGVVSHRTFYIEGEVNEPRFYGAMGYFYLKDDKDTRMACRLMSFKLNQAGFPLNEGLQVIVKGNFVITKRSELLFDVQSIRLTGEGELARNLKLLEEKLRREGYFDESRKRTPSPYPERIALLASSHSAALNDFTKVLFERRPYGVTIYHIPIKTQGIGAEQEILTQITQLESYIKRYGIQTVVVTRGGGSKDDLFVFNSEKIVRAIHGISIPTIVAIGHERDETLSEFAADLRASTPSNAAQLVSASSDEITKYAHHIVLVATHATQARVQKAGHVKTTIIQQTTILIQGMIASQRNIVRDATAVLQKTMTHTRVYIDQTVSRSVHVVQQVIQQTRYDVFHQSRDAIHVVQTRLLETKHYIDTLHVYIQAHNPQSILEKGYTLITQKGRHIQSSHQLEKDTPFTITFHDGDFIQSER